MCTSFKSCDKILEKRCRLLIGIKEKMLDLYEVEVIEKGENKGFLETEETGEINFAYGFLELM